MQYGFVLPGGTARQQLEHAILAEQKGWDGVFVWEAAYGADAWTLLSAIAQRTTRIKIGTMLTPLPWRRPWKVASQAATLDQLSGGRVILSVGLGATEASLHMTGEVTDRRTRAEMLDEGIDLIHNAWAGKLQYQGKHYTMEMADRTDLVAMAQPVQERIPIWVVAAWPQPKSMRRVIRCDGILPVVKEGASFQVTRPEHITAMRAWLREHGARPDVDIVMEGVTPADDPTAAAAIVAPWAEAGCTWWVDVRWDLPHNSDERMQQVHERLSAGPPRPA